MGGSRDIGAAPEHPVLPQLVQGRRQCLRLRGLRRHAGGGHDMAACRRRGALGLALSIVVSDRRLLPGRVFSDIVRARSRGVYRWSDN